MTYLPAYKTLLVVCSLIGLLVVTGCASGPTVRSNVDPNADFNSFTTFGFVEPLATDREGFRSFISQQLVTSTTRELEARGLQHSDTDPQLLINFSADLDQRLRVRQTPVPANSGIQRHRRGFYNTWPMYQQTEITQYTKGTVGIDVIDASKRQLIWEGLALGRVTQSTMDNIGPALNDAVVEIFRKFPLPTK